MVESNSTAGHGDFETGDDLLAALVRAAGRRPAPTAVERERVERTAHAAWRAMLARRRRRRFLYALAAGIAVAGVAGVLTLPGRSPAGTVATVAAVSGRAEVFDPRVARWQPVAYGAALARGAVVRTQDARIALDVPRGGSLRIGARTELEFESSTRASLRGGTVYFDSGTAAASGGARLEVVTPRAELRDVGTQFEAYSSAGELRVRVREGMVELRVGGAPTATVAAGEEVELDSAGAIERRPFAADDEAWAWAVSLATLDTLDGRTALDVLRWAARELGKELRFADAAIERHLRTTVLSGTQRDLEPEETLEVVIATADGLAYELAPGAIVVRRR